MDEVLWPIVSNKAKSGRKNKINQIVVVQSSVLQRFVERFFDATLVVPRKFRSHKELLPRDTTLPYCFAYRVFGAIKVSSVDMPVASLENGSITAINYQIVNYHLQGRQNPRCGRLTFLDSYSGPCSKSCKSVELSMSSINTDTYR